MLFGRQGGIKFQPMYKIVPKGNFFFFEIFGAEILFDGKDNENYFRNLEKNPNKMLKFTRKLLIKLISNLKDSEYILENDLKFSVNVPALLFFDDNFIEFIKKDSIISEMIKYNIALEVTERDFPTDSVMVMKLFEKLGELRRSTKIRIYLDDYCSIGGKHPNFAELVHNIKFSHPLNKIKIEYKEGRVDELFDTFRGIVRTVVKSKKDIGIVCERVDDINIIKKLYEISQGQINLYFQTDFLSGKIGVRELIETVRINKMAANDDNFEGGLKFRFAA